MEKNEIKNNPLKLEIYINGKPDVSSMPKDLQNAWISFLADKVIESIKKKNKKNS